eukprot:4127034-Prymnesium_polylepis.1
MATPRMHSAGGRRPCEGRALCTSRLAARPAIRRMTCTATFSSRRPQRLRASLSRVCSKKWSLVALGQDHSLQMLQEMLRQTIELTTMTILSLEMWTSFSTMQHQ